MSFAKQDATKQLSEKLAERYVAHICHKVALFILYRTFVRVIIIMLSLPPTQEGGEIMSIIIAFLISVAAGVVSYYICKWLDRDNRDN